ncbi:MAG TPA: PilZ domain-containing protein [Planctomycetes bacterium]|nr:PilZ domain-containing protein [Planctomycetota bacterium]HIK83219.1 PilZ domain-containing protein [Planctomycetota bacterium]
MTVAGHGAWVGDPGIASYPQDGREPEAISARSPIKFQEATLTTSIESYSQRREFVKLPTEIPVRYKFLSKEIEISEESVFEGSTSQIGGGGLMLHGKIPSYNWIPALLMGKIHLGVNLLLPSLDHAIKGLCQVAWIEEITENRDRCTLGLRFTDIEKEDQDQVMKYLIRSQVRR